MKDIFLELVELVLLATFLLVILHDADIDHTAGRDAWREEKRRKLDEGGLLTDENGHTGIELADGKGEGIIGAVGLHGGVNVVGCYLADVVSRHVSSQALV